MSGKEEELHRIYGDDISPEEDQWQLQRDLAQEKRDALDHKPSDEEEAQIDAESKREAAEVIAEYEE